MFDILNYISSEIDLAEMDKLAEGLTAKGIPFTRENYFNGEQIICDGWDAVCHDCSYGHEKGLLEIMGNIVDKECGDEVEGYLTAQDILDRL